MIKQVLKRDGSLEVFDPSKLNKWVDWASETCGVSWSDVLLEASKRFSDKMSTEDIQKILIDVCVNRQDTGHSRMASRLLVGHIYKEVFGGIVIPHIKDFYKKMVGLGYWADIGYTDEELSFIESNIDHTIDFSYEYCTIRQFYDKYAVSAYGKCLESPQFALVGAAMSNTQYETNRAERAIDAYKELSALLINLPTPSLAGQRTTSSGSPSCCVITGDDSVPSIDAAVHVAYTMTAIGSGIGAELDVRSPKDPVKGGTIEHMGKLPYYRYLDRAVKANKQHTRGGSATVTYSVFDPEIETLLRLKSQRVHPENRIDMMDYSLGINNLFVKKFAESGDWMLVSKYHAPRLYELQYSDDIVALEEEYNRVAASDVKKKFVKARAITKLFFTQRGDVGRIYKANNTNMNKHTPFKDPIRLSNLCMEICLATHGFPSIADLYQYKGVGEVALCFLASIVVGKMPEVAPGYLDPNRYYEVAYQVLKFVDNTIDQSTYPFPAVEYTAKARRSVGIGVTDVAHFMAKNGYKYDSIEGRNAIHRLAELHSYSLHKAAVQLAKERGKCDWFHKTKYSDEKPWLPIDTYAKHVDTFHTQELLCDWEGLRAEIKKYGLRFSVLEAHMPVESSSLFTASTNGWYPIREKKLFKKSPKGTVYFEAPEVEKFGENYQNAYDVDVMDMLVVYGLIQKFTGQSISADLYQDVRNGKKISIKNWHKALVLSAMLGIKTWYYLNSLTVSSDEEQQEVDEVYEEPACESCSL